MLLLLMLKLLLLLILCADGLCRYAMSFAFAGKKREELWSEVRQVLQVDLFGTIPLAQAKQLDQSRSSVGGQGRPSEGDEKRGYPYFPLDST